MADLGESGKGDTTITNPPAGGGTGGSGAAGGSGGAAGGGGTPGSGGTGGGAGMPAWPIAVLQFLLFAILGVLVVYFIYKGISGDYGLLDALKDQDTARGLITFLIALTTVAIALILALSTILSNDFKDRFAAGKEILTILIGVLGTIVGFYFGSATPKPAPVTPQFQIGAVELSKPQPVSGDTLSIRAQVAGGKLPDRYTITFDPSTLALVAPATLPADVPPDGKIKIDVKVPVVVVDTPINYKLEVTDGENKIVGFGGNFTIKKP